MVRITLKNVNRAAYRSIDQGRLNRLGRLLFTSRFGWSFLMKKSMSTTCRQNVAPSGVGRFHGGESLPGSDTKDDKGRSCQLWIRGYEKGSAGQHKEALMHLNKLIMRNFKKFRRAEVEFQDGLTGIVGSTVPAKAP